MARCSALSKPSVRPDPVMASSTPVLAWSEWPCPLPGGGTRGESALVCDHSRRKRLLIIPALFEEGNRMRRITAEVMRRLGGAGIDSFLPELPGLGESTVALRAQTPGDWQLAMQGAAGHFGATHALAIRGGALVAPRGLPGWRYGMVSGASLLKMLMRARIVAMREGGIEETQPALLATGREKGLALAGYQLSADFIDEFVTLVPDPASPLADIAQDMVGGGALWLRAEPGEDEGQADALAAIIAMGLAT